MSLHHGMFLLPGGQRDILDGSPYYIPGIDTKLNMPPPNHSLSRGPGVQSHVVQVASPSGALACKTWVETETADPTLLCATVTSVLTLSPR